MNAFDQNRHVIARMRGLSRWCQLHPLFITEMLYRQHTTPDGMWKVTKGILDEPCTSYTAWVKRGEKMWGDQGWLKAVEDGRRATVLLGFQIVQQPPVIPFVAFFYTDVSQYGLGLRWDDQWEYLSMPIELSPRACRCPVCGAVPSLECVPVHDEIRYYPTGAAISMSEKPTHYCGVCNRIWTCRA